MNELQTQSSVGLTTLQGFELAQRAAKMLSASSLVPKEYQGPAGLPNCVIALNMAHRIGADPLMVMQNLIVVHGRPTWSSQFLIATFNSCGRFSAMRFEFFGEKGTDDYGCRAVATELSTGERLSGTDVTIAIAKAEGWFGRNGSKWKTMPDQMLRYRAASWFVRTIAPELSMGLHTDDELVDIGRGSTQAAAEQRGAVIDNDGVILNANDLIISKPEETTLAGGNNFDWYAALDACVTERDIEKLSGEMPEEVRKELDSDIEERIARIKD